MRNFENNMIFIMTLKLPEYSSCNMINMSEIILKSGEIIHVFVILEESYIEYED